MIDLARYTKHGKFVLYLIFRYNYGKYSSGIKIKNKMSYMQ